MAAEKKKQKALDFENVALGRPATPVVKPEHGAKKEVVQAGQCLASRLR